MKKLLTEKETQIMLTKAAVKNGVSPKKIASLLLSKKDLDDLKNNLISQECLNLHVHLWLQDGQQRDMINLFAKQG